MAVAEIGDVWVAKENNKIVATVIYVGEDYLCIEVKSIMGHYRDYLTLEELVNDFNFSHKANV